MNDQIFINGKELELSNDTIIALTLQINDLNTPSNKQGNLSNTIKVPLTQNNIAIFEAAQSLTSETIVPYRRLPARILRKGIDVKGFEKCYAIFETSDDNFNLTLYSGNMNFFSRLGSRKISDLDLSAYDHTWDLSTVHTFRGNTSGFIYPLIDTNGGLIFSNANRVVDVRDMIACIYVHSIFERILLEANYTAQGNILSDNQYKLAVINCVSRNSDFKKLLAASFQSQDQIVNHFGGQYWSENSNVDTPTLNPNGYIHNVNSFGYYQVPLTGTYTFHIHVSLNVTDCTNLRIYFGTTLLDAIGAVGDFEQWYTINAAVPQGNQLGINFIGQVAPFGSLKYTIKSGTSFACTFADVGTTTLGNIFPISCNLPDMTQAEFVLAMMNLFCIFPQCDTADEILQMNGFQEISDARNRAPNWSDKVQGGVSPQVAYCLSGLSQNNYLQWAADKRVPDYLGQGIIPVDDQTLPLSSTLIKLPFAASEMIVRLQGLDCPTFVFGDSTPRMFIMDFQANISGANISWYDGSSTYGSPQNIPLAYFTLPGKQYNLGFFENLLQKYYAGFMAMVFQPKVPTIPIWLTEDDLNSFDHLVPVFIDKTIKGIAINGYFYVNIASNYLPDQPTQCTLIRI